MAMKWSNVLRQMNEDVFGLIEDIGNGRKQKDDDLKKLKENLRKVLDILKEMPAETFPDSRNTKNRYLDLYSSYEKWHKELKAHLVGEERLNSVQLAARMYRCLWVFHSPKLDRKEESKRVLILHIEEYLS
jgi:hypothetical protein